MIRDEDMTRIPLLFAIAMLIALVISGCATQLRNTSEVIGQGDALLKTGYHDTLVAYQTGVITKTQAIDVYHQFHAAETTLDTARLAYIQGDDSAAYSAANTAHIAIQAAISALSTMESKHGR